MARVNGVFDFDIFPGIFLELLDTEAHLTLVAVEGEDNGFHLVANLHEVLSAAQMLAPAHFAHVNQTFYAGSNLHECAIVGHNHNFAFDFVAPPTLISEARASQGWG